MFQILLSRISSKRRSSFLIPLFLIPVFFSCSQPAVNFADSLQKKWTFHVSASNEVGAIPAKKYSITFSEDKVLGNFILKEDSLQCLSGSWALLDSTLRFEFKPNEELMHLDSSFSERGTPPFYNHFVHFEDTGLTVPSSAEATKTVLSFKISSISEDKLILLGETGTFEFVHEPAILYSTSLSFESILRGILGLCVLIVIGYLFSGNKKAINWTLIGKGILIQIIFALLILKVPMIQSVFEGFSKFFVSILSFTREGSSFVFGGLVTNMNSFGFIFAFQVLPTILFFSALTSLLFYLGIIQKVVYVFAWMMKKLMKLSGAESLAAAGNIFLGQTESPLLIKPYIDKMTQSEILCLMSGGMATIAGGVLAAYIGFLGGDDPVEQLFFAKHLLAASLMSAPAAVVAAKLLLPESEEFDSSMIVSREKIGDNVLESITNGTIDGLKLAVNVGAMLVVFIAFIAMVNYIFKDLIGHYFGLNLLITEASHGQYDGLTLQYVLGNILRPIAWTLGASWADSALVGQLLGEKTILNEFVAYVTLGNLKQSGAFTDQKSIIIATYILCGFANFASIGIQIGGIGTLAPTKKTLLSKLGIKALIAGTLASLFTAVIVGMLI